MNELSIEEKAKAYDEIINKLRDFYRNYDTVSHLIDVKEELANIIPELKESEDERIRRWLIHYFKEVCDNVSEKEKKGVIDWLENQGEQMPADNSKSNLLTLERAKKMSPFMRSGFENESTAWCKEDEQLKEQVIYAIDQLHVCECTKNKLITWIEKQCKHDMGISEATKKKLEDNLNKALEKETTESCNEFIDKQKSNNDVKVKFKVNYVGGNEYNVLDVKNVAGITFYGIEDEPNHIDYVRADNCEIISEQNLIDKVESKFHEGDWIISNNAGNPPLHITNINDKHYIFSERDSRIKIEDCDNSYHLWSLKDAKDGDILRIRNLTFIFQEITNNNTSHKNAATAYCSYEDNDDSFGVSGPDCIIDLELITPATKEQHNLLFQKMKEAGYTFDFEKKELKKINEEIEEINGEDYGIDGLYHAQRILEKTLGKVDGYQTDDGILDHKAAITTVKKLYEQKPVWSEEDEKKMEYIANELSCLIADEREIESPLSFRHKDLYSALHWLKFLKNRIQSHNFTVTDTELIKAKKDAYNDALNKIEYHSDTPTFDDGWSAAINYIRKKYIKYQK